MQFGEPLEFIHAQFGFPIDDGWYTLEFTIRKLGYAEVTRNTPLEIPGVLRALFEVAI